MKYIIMDKNGFKNNILSFMDKHFKEEHKDMLLDTYLRILLKLKQALDIEFKDEKF